MGHFYCIIHMHDPFLLPHRCRDVSKAIGVSLAQGIAELGADDAGECFHGEQKVLA
jgi:hypothetical protein